MLSPQAASVYYGPSMVRRTSHLNKIRPKMMKPLFPKKKDDGFSEEFYEDVSDDMPHPCDKVVSRRTPR
jgi:hypothetical protein